MHMEFVGSKNSLNNKNIIVLWDTKESANAHFINVVSSQEQAALDATAKLFIGLQFMEKGQGEPSHSAWQIDGQWKQEQGLSMHLSK